MPGETEQSNLLPPPVYWAQSKGHVYLNVGLEDCQKPTIKLQKDKLYFKGVGGSDKKEHEVTLEFCGEIKPDDSKYVVRGRGTEFVLVKADESAPYWKRLLKDDKKHHWLKVDFNKWREEDDTDDEMGADGGDFEDMMRQMGGLGQNTGLDDLEDKEESDDDLPELED